MDVVNVTADTPSTLLMRAPRAPFLEFLLHFATFGLYTGFWLVGRARDINRLTDAKLTPWLWFFVPYLVIAQIIAFPKLCRHLRALERDRSIPGWGPWQGIWLGAVIALTIFSNVSSYIEFPLWTVVAGVIAWAVLFSAMQVRFNRIKPPLSDGEWKRSYRGYTVIEWVVLIPMLPVTTLLTGYMLVSPLLVGEIKALSVGEAYIDEVAGYRIPVVGSGWAQVDSGSFSDGDAELELQGPLMDSYFLVFNHGQDADLDAIAQFRIADATENITGSKCQEIRRFAETSLTVIATTVCEGTVLGDPVLQLTSVIKTDAGFYELYGKMTALKHSYNEHVTAFRRMAEGFQPR